MTVVASCIFETAQLAATNTTLYASPANTRVLIDKMTVTNTTAGALTVTVFLVPSAGSAGAATTVISVQSIAANAAYLCPEVVGHILNPGDSIVAVASAATSLVARVSGRVSS